jgi:succinoglycan biosynthesis transport protein ExoP
MQEDKLVERNLPAVQEVYRLPSYAWEPAAEEESSVVPLSHYLWILKRYRWRILGFILATVVATVLISSRVTPMFESTATIDVDPQTPFGVVGQESTRTLNSSFDADQILATQVRLIQSDSVLRPVVQKYRLRDAKQAPPAQPSVNPEDLEEAPVSLGNLKVVRQPNTYLLLISYRSPDRRRAAEVANDIAQSYIQHIYNIRYRSASSLSSFMEKQIEGLKAKMERSSAALAQHERELNVINPEEKTSILSARLLQLNTEYTNAQAERVRKESAYQSVQSGSLEAAQVSKQGESLQKLSDQLDAAQQKFADVRTHYGAQHPEYKKGAAQVTEIQRLLESAKRNIQQRVQVEYREAANREMMLQKAVAETKAEFDGLNARSFEYQALKREAEADKKLYDELVRKIEEAGINASFQSSSIRIADPARPSLGPVSPNIRLNALLALLLSTVLAVGAAIISDMVDDTIRDPEQITRRLKTEVIGSLPVVKPWRGKANAVITTHTDDAGDLVRYGQGNHTMITSFDQAVRTLRNSILLSDVDRRLQSLMVTSASPGEGKSTIAAHLAVAHAQQKHRTLLIDGDLRRPSAHRLFGITTKAGFTSVLMDGVPWRDVLVGVDDLPELDILPVGRSSRRAADLIGKRLLGILEEASAEYDLVVLDSPPLLGFAEPLQMATAVDGVVIVTLAGQTSRKAVSSVLQTLKRLRSNVVGLVLNEVSKDLGDMYYYYGHGYGYYKYYHRNGEQEA